MGRAQLLRDAYHEFKVTRQITTGNGEAYLEASERPPPAFVGVELGYYNTERPCSDCHKPCTLDYTLANLREINQRNITAGLRAPESAPTERVVREAGVKAPKPPAPMLMRVEAGKKKGKKGKGGCRVPMSESMARMRRIAGRAGVSVVGTEYVDRGTWTPFNPNRFGRHGLAYAYECAPCDQRTLQAAGNPKPPACPRCRAPMAKGAQVDRRAERLIRAYRAQRAEAAAAQAG